MLLWLFQGEADHPRNLEMERFALAVEWAPLLTRATSVTVYI